MNPHMVLTCAAFATGVVASAVAIILRLAGETVASVVVWTLAACALLAGAALTLCGGDSRGSVAGENA